MSKKEDGNSKLGWKIGSAILIVLFGLVVWGVTSLFWTGSSKPIESVANQFKAEPEWELTQNQVEGPKNWCGDLVCPSVSRQWKTDHTLSQEEFRAILKRSGWNFPITDLCLPNKNTFGEHIELCSAQGVVDKYRVSLSVSASNPPGQSWIGLRVEENR